MALETVSPLGYSYSAVRTRLIYVPKNPIMRIRGPRGRVWRLVKVEQVRIPILATPRPTTPLGVLVRQSHGSPSFAYYHRPSSAV